jgi:hypothetical protein
MQELLQKFVGAVVNPMLQVAMMIALVLFVYGVFNFIRGADQPDVRTTGQKHMLAGIIGLAIMVSAFTIIRLIIGTIGAETPDIIRF